MRRAGIQRAAMLAPALLLTGLLLVLPVAFLLRTSIAGAAGPGNEPAPPLEAYRRILTDPYTLGIIGRTFLISAIVTLVCLVIGLPVANLVWRATRRWRPLITLIVLSPLLVSVVVSAFGWVVLLGSKGVINQALVGFGVVRAPLPLLYTDFSLAAGLTHVLLPFMVLSLLAALDKVDPLLVDAGLMLGATRLSLWRTVLFPLMLPGVGAGTIVVFALAVSSYVTPAVLGPNGPNFITTLIYENFINLYDWGAGSALAVILLAASALVILIYTAWLSRLVAPVAGDAA
ncbi:MAG: ABC transporter permease [Acidisphaera sp.]|nr:ABC transporter permease [Acidisphaera sp.]MBV9813629.1 ABC transporter permease [Acetobacteraceae bacterium]